MKHDMNPSVVCGLFCTQKGYTEFMKAVDNRKGMRVREIRFVDIGIPLNEDFNDNINFLKGGSNPMLSRIVLTKFPFRDLAFKKLGLKPFNYSKRWQTDIKNPMLFSGLTPLFIDDKYNKERFYTPEEMEMCKRLLTFETPDYKPDLSAISKNQNDVGDKWE